MTSPANIGSIRNIAVLAHVDAGRTTTTERILALADRSGVAGEEHGMTLTAAATTCGWRGHSVTIIDAPSSLVHGTDAARAIRVVDGAVALIDAESGVEAQLEALWRLADDRALARIVFVNKMDRVGADFGAAVEAVRSQLKAVPLVLALPLGQGSDFIGIIDLVRDRALTWKAMPFGAAFAEEPIPADRLVEAQQARAALIAAVAPKQTGTAGLVAAIRAAVVAGTVVPVLPGSAFRNKGMQPLLDAIVDYLPSPDQVGAVEVQDPVTGSFSSRAANDDAPLTVFAFRSGLDPIAGPLVFARVFSGVLEQGAEIANATTGRATRVSRVLRFEASDRVELARATAGDIVALGGLNEARPGDTLTAPGQLALVEPKTEQVRSRSA